MVLLALDADEIKEDRRVESVTLAAAQASLAVFELISGLSSEPMHRDQLVGAWRAGKADAENAVARAIDAAIEDYDPDAVASGDGDLGVTPEVAREIKDALQTLRYQLFGQSTPETHT